MAIKRNIGSFHSAYIEHEDMGVNDWGELAAVGTAGRALEAKVNEPYNFPLQWPTSRDYPNVFYPYLQISEYRDNGGERRITNRNEVAAELNRLIASGPDPGHTVDGDFVQWIYDTSTHAWNFYYAGGVKPGFSADSILPANYPRPLITEDGRLVLDREGKLDDSVYPEIHILTAWLQAIINANDPTPYPLRHSQVKELSQHIYGDYSKADLFSPSKAKKSFFKSVGKFLENSINFVKDGVLKIVGSIPRNSFLGLTGLNMFNMASNMWDKIQAGEWDAIKHKWESLGGNAEKLYNTIEGGKDKKAILGTTDFDNTIGEPMTASAIIAAAAPIIAIMLKFIGDKDGKVQDILAATKGFIETKYPNIDVSPLGFLDKKTGKPIEFVVDAKDNENLGGGSNDMPGVSTSDSMLLWAKNNSILISASVAGLVFMLSKNKKDFKKPLLLGGGTYLALKLMNK